MLELTEKSSSSGTQEVQIDAEVNNVRTAPGFHDQEYRRYSYIIVHQQL